MKEKKFIIYCHELKGETKAFTVVAQCRSMAEGQAMIYCYKNNLIFDKSVAVK